MAEVLNQQTIPTGWARVRHFSHVPAESSPHIANVARGLTFVSEGGRRSITIDEMVAYRIYLVNRAGQLQGPPIVIECQNDDAVVIKAREYVDGSSAEIWDEARKVATIPADD